MLINRRIGSLCVLVSVSAVTIINSAILGQCLANESQKLLPGDLEQGDRFGTAVSVDGEIAIIGASQHAQMGAVYI